MLATPMPKYDPLDPSTHPANQPRVVPVEMVWPLFQFWEQWLAPKMLEYRRVDALWRTDFWRASGFGAGLTQFADKDGMLRVEVNRIYGFVVSYLGALFPDSLHVEVTGATRGPGTRKKAQVYLDEIVLSRDVVERVIFAMQLGLTIDGCGMKVSIDHDEENPDEKVKIRAVPWWSIVPDLDVTDIDDQRYVMHVTFIPRAEAIRRFHDPKIHGGLRPEPLSRGNGNMGLPATATVTALPDAMNEGFVRVVEVYNFKDKYWLGEADPVNGAPMPDGWQPVVDDMGHPVGVRGRFEVYLPDQPGGWGRPRAVHPFPLSDVDGRPVCPLHVLTFNNELGYPLRGIAPVRNVVNQFVEKNLSRTFMANAVKKNSRQLFVEEDLINQKAADAYSQGLDGALLKVKPDENGKPLRERFAIVPVQQISPDNARYDMEIDGDIALGGARATASMGQAEDTSATQFLGIEEHQRTQMGLLELRRDAWLRKVFGAVISAQRSALEACGPSAYVEVDVNDERQQITADDLRAVFRLKIKSGPSSLAAEERKKREIVMLFPLLAPLIEGVRNGDPVAKMFFDYVMDLYDLPSELTSKTIEKLLADMPKPPPPAPEVPRGAGAASAPPGAGSMPSPSEMPTAEGTGGMGGASPMPQPPQPDTTQSGQAQNIHAAGTPASQG